MKFFKVLFIILLCLNNQVNAQGKSDWINYNSRISKNFTDTIPFEIVANKIIIPVTLQGKTRKFIFDTGAPCMIKEEVLNEINHKIIEKRALNDIKLNEYQHVFFTIDSFQIGDISYRDIPSYDFKSDSVQYLFNCLEFDGIIGSNILYDLIVKIDYKNKFLILSDKNGVFNNHNKKFTRDLKISNFGKPFIKVKITPKVNDFILFDTGDDGFYTISNNAISQFERLKVKTSDYLLDNIKSSDSISISLLKFNDLQVADVSFNNVVTSSTDVGYSRIGAQLLHYGEVILDFKNKKYSYIPFNEINSQIYLPQTLRDFSITVKNNKLIIDLIWPKSEAYRLGIRKGDEILEFNGLSVDNNICELFLKNQLKSISNKITLKIKSENGGVRTDVLSNSEVF